MKLPVLMIRAFTCESVAFSGNPAAIIIQQQVDKNGVLDPVKAKPVPIPPKYKQKIASEMNLSETAYIESSDECKSVLNGDTFKLQWFTPTNEVSLCGHATLASAAALLLMGGSASCMTFHTLSGDLSARSTPEGSITLDFPANPPEPLTHNERTQVDALVKAVVGDESVVDVQMSKRAAKLLVHVDNDCDISHINPSARDLLAQNNLEGSIKGVIVTARDPHGRYDFVSRYFAPWNGIDEDPVTGSAHTVLAPYWANLLPGQSEFTAHQASPRGGDLHLRLRSDGRVDIVGNTQLVYRGVYELPDGHVT